MGADSDAGSPPAIPWRKVLYEHQPYPDNYVDCRFLEELRRNIRVHHYRYWAVVREAGLVSQQLACVALFLTLWSYMDRGYVAPSALLWAGLGSSVLGYTLYEALGEGSDRERTRLADLQSTSVFLAFTFGFSPVLKTLTESVSTDTVYAMATGMIMAHLVSFPYTKPSLPGSLSLNAAFFASVCLASRLPGTLHTFAMMCCALLIFALWPCLLQRMRRRAEWTFPCAAAMVCVGGVATVGTVWPAGALLLFLALVVLTLVCPLLLVLLQRQKDNIHGPWDEAEIREDLSRFLR